MANSTAQDSFEVQYAVPMTCAACVSDIKRTLRALEGVNKLAVDLKSQRVTVQGSALPSGVVKALRAVGRDAIVRGTGAPNSAAVAILEDEDGNVHGLARIVQVENAAAENAAPATVFDISVSSEFGDARLFPAVNTYGDVSRGAASTGPALYSLEPFRAPHSADRIAQPVANMIGRAFVVNVDSAAPGPLSLAGVIARSAGTWENDKSVCSCSGQTVWEERAAIRTGLAQL